MTLHELATLVAKMRDAQRRYFRTRAIEHLRISTELEKAVDAVTDAVLKGPRLFEETP